MALNKDVLDRLNVNAQLVYDETKASANTHTRVGQAFLDTHELFTEVANGSGIPSVALSDLDTLFATTDLTKKEDNVAYYAVYAPSPAGSAYACVGVLQNFIDPDTSTSSTTFTLHVFTQVFTTNLRLVDGGFDITNYDNKNVYVYTRSVDPSATPEITTGWRLMTSSDVNNLSVVATYLKGLIDGVSDKVGAISPRLILPIGSIVSEEVNINPTSTTANDGTVVWCSANEQFALQITTTEPVSYYSIWNAQGIYPTNSIYSAELTEGANAEVWYYVQSEGAFYYWGGSGMVKITSIDFATQSDLAKKQDTLTQGDGIKIENNVVSIDPTYALFQNLVKTQVDTFIANGGGSADNIVALMQSAGLGNLYVKLVNSSEGESVVTLNGSSVAIGAGETYEGYVDSFTAVSIPHNLKSVVVVGDDGSVIFDNSSGTENETLESIEMYRTSGWSGTMQYFARNNLALKRAVVTGGSPTNMRSAFSSCGVLESVDITRLDTSACTAMNYMFNLCEALASVDLSNLDTSKVTTMYQMFRGCSALTSLDVSNFNTSQVTTMRQMFYGCSALTSLDVTNFDTSQVTTMLQMFYGCSALTSLDVSNFNTSQVTTMQSMFYGCSALTSLDVSNFNTSQVTIMYQMFSSCTQLVEVTFGDKWDLGAVENTQNMFYQASAFTTAEGAISNIKISLSISNSPLTRESALVFINGLYDYASEGEKGGTLTLSSTTKGYLTDDDIAIATDKGWTIA